MNKVQFKKVMKDLKEQSRIDSKVSAAFNVILPNDWTTNVENILFETIIGILENAFDDKGKWIEYYIWELDFGRKNDSLKCWDKNDVEIPLTTVDDLYRLLTKGK